MINIKAVIFLDIDIDQFVRQKIEATMVFFKKKINFYSDTLSFIQKIKKGNIQFKDISYIEDKPKLAMVTGLEREFVEILLKHHDFSDLFKVTISATDYTLSKG